jgi:hypothetical protein
LDLLNGIKPASFQLQFNNNIIIIISFLETGRSHRVPNQGSTVGGGWQPFCVSPETTGGGRKCEKGRCHGEATRSVLAKVRGDVFAGFNAVAVKRRSRTRNSQFGLLRPVLRATTIAVQMTAPFRNILDSTSYALQKHCARHCPLSEMHFVKKTGHDSVRSK